MKRFYQFTLATAVMFALVVSSAPPRTCTRGSQPERRPFKREGLAHKSRRSSLERRSFEG